MTRVLRVIARLNVGGPARHVTILDRGLRVRGFDTLLVHGDVGPGEGSLESLLATAGIPSTRVPELGRRVSLMSDLRALLRVIRTVFRMRPDIVHTHTAKAGTLGRIAALLYNASRSRRNRCLVVHTFHGHVLHGYFGPLGSAAVRVIERTLARVTDCILVLSPRQRDEIVSTYRVATAAQTHIVPLGLELEELFGLSVKAVGRPDGVVFGFVGRFVPVKNLPLLLEAFAAVRRDVPGARLILVGDGEERPILQRVVRERQMEEAVEFAGWSDDLTGVYASIDVLVLTSRNEGTPVAVIEAMAAGLPVVATAVGGVPDVVEHERTGLLVESDDSAGLSAAMLLLARDHALRARIGAAARDAVQARFTAQRLVQDMAALYDAEVRRKRGARHPLRGRVLKRGEESPRLDRPSQGDRPCSS